MKISHLNQHPLSLIPKTPDVRPSQKPTFQGLLKDENSSIKISKHAKQRMADRGIVVEESQWSKMKEKMSEARSKGVNDSLVLLDQAAFIVNVKNNTVITAMNRNEAKDQIFTNINGTIILN
ncbi:TIGR02530 family flagellar biosynthesis protein [Metabacillus dongyingensis]|uniref:TIGR02530 family flagellar biosynthesis protein n=1 Tax=Metabacillus dongyingensis TaxID=2874282 RepID=UPI001CBD7351|nr:TIGR02530 family flagellar biosynthesis protein [Metabacillus dongyingensis]UAL54262.1 flagellar protein [Metabacillus dongyingensis]